MDGWWLVDEHGVNDNGDHEHDCWMVIITHQIADELTVADSLGVLLIGIKLADLTRRYLVDLTH